MIFISKCKLLFHTYTIPFEFRSSLNKKNNNFPPRKKESISGGRGVVGHPWPGYRGVLFTSVWKYSAAHASTISSSSLLFSLSLPLFRSFCPPPFYFSSSTSARVYILHARACLRFSFSFLFSILESPVGSLEFDNSYNFENYFSNTYIYITFNSFLIRQTY